MGLGNRRAMKLLLGIMPSLELKPYQVTCSSMGPKDQMRTSRVMSGEDLLMPVRNHFYALMNSIGNGYDEYKEQAKIIAEKVSENAKILKDKALDWFSTFTGN